MNNGTKSLDLNSALVIYSIVDNKPWLRQIVSALFFYGFFIKIRILNY